MSALARLSRRTPGETRAATSACCLHRFESRGSPPLNTLPRGGLYPHSTLWSLRTRVLGPCCHRLSRETRGSRLESLRGWAFPAPNETLRSQTTHHQNQPAATTSLAP